MKYFRPAYNILAHKILFHILIIFEIAAVLVLTNIVISSYNGKSFLYDPYREFLQNEGVVYEADMTMSIGNNHEDIKAIIDKYNYLHYPSLLSLLKERLEGDIQIIYSRYYWLDAKNGGPEPVLFSEPYVQMIGVDPTVFSRLRLPLAFGRWPRSRQTESGETEIVISGGTNASLGQIFNTPVGKLKVVGILTDSTYIPPGINAAENIKKKFGILDYYQPYDCNITLRSPFVLLDREIYDKIVPSDDPNYGSYFFISYGHVDNAVKERNNEYLRAIGGRIREQYGEEDFNTIVEETEKELQDIYLRMLPIILTAIAVVLAGLTGTMSMSVIRELKTFGIFYLCGCNWKNCKKIISAQLTIVFSLSVMIAVFALFVMNIIKMDYLIGAVYGWNNLLVSLVEIAAMYLLAVILPHNIIKSSSPVETIKEC